MSINRESSSDFDAAWAIWNQRNTLELSSERLHQLIAAVAAPIDLHLGQWAQWYASALEFKPDLIVEFGRGAGNSTALFTEAAQHLPGCRILSFCLSTDWDVQTKSRIASFVPSNWFDPLDAQVGDIRAPDMVALLDDAVSIAKRVLVLWDAHGFAIAEYILGHLLPLMEDKNNLILMHDLVDLRYSPDRHNYDGQGVWSGGYDHGFTQPAAVVLGHIYAFVSQSVAIVDFTSRNQIELHSADHELHTELTEDQRTALAIQLGDLWRLPGDWFWFTTFGCASLTYPHWDPATPIASEQVSLLEKRIRDMEASPFWKVRSLFARLTRR